LPRTHALVLHAQLELLAKLRIRKPDGSIPEPAHDASRCHQHDFDYWLESQPNGEPALAKEWSSMLKWVSTATPSILSRRVLSADEQKPIIIHEVGRSRRTLALCNA
jgi:hypothetical protein